MIHSCGDVDELFDDLVGDRPELLQSLPARGDGRLRACCRATAAGWPSTAACPRSGRCPSARRATSGRETGGCWSWARDGGYIFAPAHAVEGDVPLENMLAMLEVLQQQPGYAASGRRRA